MKRNTRILESIEAGDLAEFSALVSVDEIRANEPNDFGSWLHVASSEGQLAIVEYLLANGADINLAAWTFNAGPIRAAVCHGQLDVVRYLLVNGALLEVANPSQNCLFGAIYEGRCDIVQTLLEAGIDSNVVYRTEAGALRNAYSYAVERGQTKIATMLLKAGCRLPMEENDRPVNEPAD